MAGLERLRLLIQWGNVVGIQPFRMELGANTGSFQGFKFSWKHPWTCWFLFSCLLHTSCFIYLRFPSEYSPNQEDLSIITKIAYFTIQYNYFVLALGPYLLLFRWKNLATVVNNVRKFDQMVGPTGTQSCTTKRRIVIGITMTIVKVRISTFLIVRQSS